MTPHTFKNQMPMLNEFSSQQLYMRFNCNFIGNHNLSDTSMSSITIRLGLFWKVHDQLQTIGRSGDKMITLITALKVINRAPTNCPSRLTHVLSIYALNLLG